jgi:hypothetical protein
MIIKAKIVCEQVRDGTCYKGRLIVGGVTFEYELALAIPIPQLIERGEPAQSMVEFRQIFLVTLKKNGEVVPLADDKAYAFFCAMVLDSATRLYRDPSVRDMCEGHGRAMVDLLGTSFGTTIVPTMESKLTIDISEDMRRRLADTKFGCVFS